MESGFRVGKRRAEPDYNSHRFQEEMDYNSHEAALHIQDNDTRSSIPTSPWGSLRKPSNCQLVVLNPESNLGDV